MHKILIFFTFIIGTSPLSSHMPDDSLFQNPALLKILELTDIEHDKTREDIIRKTQERWLQKEKERWEFEERFTGRRKEIFPWLRSFGVIDRISSSSQHFDYAAIHGGLFSRVYSRLLFLIDEWNKGVRFDTLVFLTGDRDLVIDRESIEIFKSFFPDKKIPFIPKIESEMVEMIYHLTDLPKEMRDLKVQFIHAPKINGKRPNTGHTVQKWLQMKPEAGSVLFISNQPYVHYQHAIAKTYMPLSFTFITVGDAAQNIPLSIHLDNLAKWLYQENIYFEKSKCIDLAKDF